MPVLADLFDGTGLAPAHLFFSGKGHSSLEYRIPGSASYATMLRGDLDDRSFVVILELKHWATRDDTPGRPKG